MKILLFGNTGYVTKKFIQEAFPKDTVYLVEETDLKSSKKLKLTVFPKTKEAILVEVLRTYQFDQIRLFVNYSGLMSANIARERNSFSLF
ncbi:hypothetical protein DXB55_04865 [Streptococcus anginosus]|uniref:hypothetical protein n=1 Tax=Streptococcus anginosus TaxID=1328 RepID=UPI000E43F68F|nr:hypothetical protein [Streptococcus anginosus]RGN67490.1 hypothetical protein DXB55_04865 [Streptococcus anginosus]